MHDERGEHCGVPARAHGQSLILLNEKEHRLGKKAKNRHDNGEWFLRRAVKS